MNIKKPTTTLMAILLLGGCAGKELIPEKNQESAFIIIKTPTMRYADMGFLYKKTDLVKVEIYSMGQPLLTLDINGMNVCMSTFKCMSKEDFNKKMLHDSYPPTLLEHIFKAQPIFEKEGYEKISNGFTQKIKKEGAYDITYSVTSDKRTFRDKINKIKIEVSKR